MSEQAARQTGIVKYGALLSLLTDFMGLNLLESFS